MKILLVAINAKFIHTCPAIYSLRSYALSMGSPLPEIALCEYTINDRYMDILSSLLETDADVIAFSTYIWNSERSRRLIRDIKKAREDLLLLAGGPEAGYAPLPFLLDGIELCMCGEGEETFLYLARTLAMTGALPTPEQLKGHPGFAFLENGKLTFTGMAPCVNLDELPFLYQDMPLPRHRIIYYESSRGCPYSCAYCLSGKEKGIRTRSLALVEKELQFFLDEKVPQVKFMDRTFNAIPSHAMAIWTYLKEHDNSITNFHFEIEARAITKEEILLLKSLRPGLIQMEIGVQSANEVTLRSVCRSPDLGPIEALMKELVPPQNINLHLDLIAGLPYEGLESFARSFNKVYALTPHQFQLGFLKLLPGTPLWEKRDEYDLIASSDAPYEILKTRWLSIEELNLLRRISDTVEIYVNSQGFRHSLPLLETLFPDAFTLFAELTSYRLQKGQDGSSLSLAGRYALLTDFTREVGKRGEDKEIESEAEVLAENKKIEKEVQETDQGAQETDRQAKERKKNRDISRILETIRFDSFLHVHKSRRMQTEETFDFGDGPIRYHFDYQHTSPVNGEASCCQRKEPAYET